MAHHRQSDIESKQHDSKTHHQKPSRCGKKDKKYNSENKHYSHVGHNFDLAGSLQ